MSKILEVLNELFTRPLDEVIVKGDVGSGTSACKIPEGSTAENVRYHLRYLLTDLAIDLHLGDRDWRDELAREVYEATEIKRPKARLVVVMNDGIFHSVYCDQPLDIEILKIDVDRHSDPGAIYRMEELVVDPQEVDVSFREAEVFWKSEEKEG